MSNETKQTAVEWLWGIAYNRELTVADWKQAKEMEKNKMENLWHEAISLGGCKCYDPLMTFEQYYNETYGGKK